MIDLPILVQVNVRGHLVHNFIEIRVRRDPQHLVVISAARPTLDCAVEVSICAILADSLAI